MKLYINKYRTGYGARMAICIARSSFTAHKLLIDNVSDHIGEEYDRNSWEAVKDVECLSEAKFVTEYGYVE